MSALNDQHARRGALGDQLRASMRDLAPILSAYRAELRHAGFTNDEAMQLVIGYQAALVTPTEASA